MNSVVFEGNNLILTVHPPFIDAGFAELQNLANVHLKWLADSVSKIQLSVKTKSVPLTNLTNNLVTTPSIKSTQKKAPQTLRRRVKQNMTANLKVQSTKRSLRQSARLKRDSEQLPIDQMENSETKQVESMDLVKHDSQIIALSDNNAEPICNSLAAVDLGLTVQASSRITNSVSTIVANNNELMTDDESTIAEQQSTQQQATPKIQKLKRTNRAIQSQASTAKHTENCKRIKNSSQYQTPTFGSSRITRSKTRIKSTPSSSQSGSYHLNSRISSKSETPVSSVARSKPIKYASSESVNKLVSNQSLSKFSTPTISSSGSKRTGRLATATPDQKAGNLLKPQVSESAMKRRREDEERRLRQLKERLEKEQRAKQKKEELLRLKVMDSKSKREEREQKLAENLNQKRAIEEQRKVKQESKQKEKDARKKNRELVEKEARLAAVQQMQKERKEQESIMAASQTTGPTHQVKPIKPLITALNQNPIMSQNTYNQPLPVLVPVDQHNKENSSMSQFNDTYNLSLKPKTSIGQPLKEKQDYTNYDISSIKSDDDTDDERQPKKPIPDWARSETFITALNRQFCKPIAQREVEIRSIFCNQIGDVILENVFRGRQAVHERYERRTSSAVWTSPPSNHIKLDSSIILKSRK